MIGLLLFLFCASSSPCGDILSYRSDEVKQNFNPIFLEGFYYEQVYSDIAQVGADCQTLNVTTDGTTLSMDFSVKYGPIPFTIVEVYLEVDSSEKGYFNKNAKMPGGKLLTLPSVFVHVEGGSSRGYDAMVIYSCLSLARQKVQEVIIATKEVEVPQERLKSLIATVVNQVSDFDANDLKFVNQTKCQK